MLKSRPLVAFVATTKPASAKKFYARTLGLRLVGEDPFAIVFDADGTMLRVAIVPELRPAGYTVLGWVVPDIRKAVQSLRRRGVTFNKYDGMQQDELGVWTSPSGARTAWFADPDGNTLSLTAPPDRRESRPPRRGQAGPKTSLRSPRKPAAARRRSR
jgi:catechol 2,3-dioxygenase-like lactoylglutathione lyase family enzyme